MSRIGLSSPRLATVLVAAALVTAAGHAVAAPAYGRPAYAPASTAAIHPGVMTYTRGGQCTANFVFSDGSATYIGQAAHCASTGGSTSTNGCRTGSLPLGTPVQVRGASRPGTLVYSSWLAMQRAKEKDPNACAYNDLALVRLDPADVGKLNPSVPFFGGPVGLNTSGTSLGETVFSYGNSSLRLGVSALSPKRGVSLGDSAGGWNHIVYTVTPGIPGDSGSAFLDRSGRALGELSTVELAPRVGSNGVGDLSRELTYLRSHSTLAKVQLVLGTEPFRIR